MNKHLLAPLAALATALLPFSPAIASEVALEGAEAGKWTMDYDAAVKLAAEKDLPLLLNFTGSDWCGWCKLMDGEVFAKPAWSAWAEDHLVLVTIDFPSDESIVPAAFRARNQRLSEQFSVQGYPTYVLLDSDGETQIGQLGAGEGKTPESFIEEVEMALVMSPSNIQAKIAELGPEKGAELQSALDSLTKAGGELDAWIATQPERNPENEKKYEAFLNAIAEADAAVKSFF